MTKFEVWKRKKDMRKKTIPNDQALRSLCEDRKKLFGKSVIEDLIPMQLNGASDDDMRGYLKVYWDK